MTLTYAGKEKYSTIVGGAATILVVLAVVVQSVFAFHNLYMHPNYNQFPTTYDYGYTKQINDFDIRENMIAYAI